MKHYEVIVIGSGPAGHHAAIQAAKLGKRVAIVEKNYVGQNEDQLTQEGVPYEVGIARYREIARGNIIGDQHGLLKLLFHRHTRQLLGVHIMGEGAAELVHIGQAVLSLGGGRPDTRVEDPVSWRPRCPAAQRSRTPCFPSLKPGWVALNGDWLASSGSSRFTCSFLSQRNRLSRGDRVGRRRQEQENYQHF